MTEQNAPQPNPEVEAISRLPLCPECGESLEAHDALLLLLAACSYRCAIHLLHARPHKGF